MIFFLHILAIINIADTNILKLYPGANQYDFLQFYAQIQNYTVTGMFFTCTEYYKISFKVVLSKFYQENGSHFLHFTYKWFIFQKPLFIVAKVMCLVGQLRWPNRITVNHWPFSSQHIIFPKASRSKMTMQLCCFLNIWNIFYFIIYKRNQTISQTM